MSTPTRPGLIQRGDKGRRAGESHPNARFSDHEIGLMRVLHGQGYGYRKIARLFDCSRGYVRSVVKFNRR